MLAALLSACATGPGGDGMRIERSDVPGKALTMYRQAVEAMAAGDTIVAELRFQEFLLAYPEYPG